MASRFDTFEKTQAQKDFAKKYTGSPSSTQTDRSLQSQRDDISRDLNTMISTKGDRGAEDRRRAYASMASAGIKSLSGATTGDKAGERAREIQRGNIGGGAKFKPIADYDKGLFTIGAGDTPPDDTTPDKKGLEHIIADAFLHKTLPPLNISN